MVVMVRKMAGPILLITGMLITGLSLVYLSHKEDTECDQVIFLEGEMSMDVMDVNSYENGMSTIYLCDGKTLRVPTSRIIKIVDKEI
jgi:hypothetical protein